MSADGERGGADEDADHDQLQHVERQARGDLDGRPAGGGLAGDLQAEDVARHDGLQEVQPAAGAAGALPAAVSRVALAPGLVSRPIVMPANIRGIILQATLNACLARCRCPDHKS